jgi:alpha-D-ribose 1-methylphosphonate 5-triphosphate synthase subunit PhnL
MAVALDIRELSKSFTMHLQGGLRLPVVERVTFKVMAGSCVVLGGPSGAGKSSILKMIFGNYRSDAGQILLKQGKAVIDIAAADPRRILELRKRSVGYVSQFLRAVPRVPAIDVVAEPLVGNGVTRDEARERAAGLLRRLNISERLWELPPATFSGGEQQRVNIARGFIPDLPILLLDEPTASLDAANRAVVVDMISAKKKQGTAIVAIAHDDEVRAVIADKIVDIQQFAAVA